MDDLAAYHDEAPDRHRVNTAREPRQTQGGDRAEPARQGVAAVRSEEAQAGHLPGVSAGRRGASAPLDGIERTHRQDHARGKAALAAHADPSR